MQRTFSESAFETFCNERGIRCERVPEGPNRTPDYELAIGGVRVVVEVKEIARNDDEKESDRLLEETGIGKVTGGVPGERIRKKIADCSAQIKARSSGRHPSLLVLFDSGRGHLDPYFIRVAMFGLEQVHIAVPPISERSPYSTGVGHGPRRKMTPDQNTSISALAVLAIPSPNRIIMMAYHNPFAVVPLDRALLEPFGVDQYEIDQSSTIGASQWRAITSLK